MYTTNMDIEKKIAEEIMMTVRKFRLPLTLDVLTEGIGNCFPLAILAQCRRHDIYCNLESHIQDIIMKNNPTLLRSAVKKFILSSNHKTIKDQPIGDHVMSDIKPNHIKLATA